MASDAALSITGPQGRYAALIEEALDVLIETPGGSVAITGTARPRKQARQIIESLARRLNDGFDLTESDVRIAVGQARAGSAPAGLGGRRGSVGPKNASQSRYMDLLGRHELVFGLGPAGTGKTFLAVAHGARLLIQGQVERLIVTRPAVEAGERLGFLPGDLTEKVDPYMIPVWEALSDIMGRDALQRRRDKGEIEVAPIAFMRGRTLHHAFVIADEAQNATRLQMKMLLTRIGEGSRMAVTGDPSQIDLTNQRDSGLSHAVGLLEGVEGVGVMRFTSSDVVRHPLVERIVRAYESESTGSTGS